MTATPAQRVETIPVERITVTNPRTRNKRVFTEIIDNIAQIGLKRPITVTRRAEASGPNYDLVCGQGRLEAYEALGQHEVPALVVSADPEDCLVASLVENCARRKHRAIDLLWDIGGMKQRGHSIADIARKIGLSAEYVYAVVGLLEKGEQRLLRAVESGQIPFSVALIVPAWRCSFDVRDHRDSARRGVASCLPQKILTVFHRIGSDHQQRRAADAKMAT